MSSQIIINGQKYPVDLAALPPDITLNTFLRERAQLTATKFMCLEGGCGACICAIKSENPATGKWTIQAVNSCLKLLNTCIGSEIITSEGIGNKHMGYNPIQKCLATRNGSQCGYCSPGFVMNMYSLLQAKGGNVTMAEIENSFGGNLCRCTGYRPILDAMKSFAMDNVSGGSEEYCVDIEDLNREMICHKSGKKCSGSCKTPLSKLKYNDGIIWYWPKTLKELFDELEKIPDTEKYMLISGNTSHGVYRRPDDIQHFVDINRIPDLKKYSITNDALTLGANMSLSEAMDVLLIAAKTTGFEYCQQLWQHFDLIANVPVRNNGSLAGNITIKQMHPEFPSDVFICFEALDVQVEVMQGEATKKSMPLMDYLKGSLKKAVITAFVLRPYPTKEYIFKSYKIMPRAQNAHAYVNAGFLVQIDETFKVKSSRVCFGGINPNFVHERNVENIMQSMVLYDDKTISNVFEDLENNLKPDWILPDASPDYRVKLACGLFYKFLMSSVPEDKVKPEYRSGATVLKRAISSGSQVFSTNEKSYPVTKPMQKLEALIQCSGEATYMNDTLTTENTVHCHFVYATKVGAMIESIDASEALNVPGVLAFFSAKDIPGTNSFVDAGFLYEPEEIFCSGAVKFHSQPLGVIAATTSDVARRASERVKVIYTKQSEEEILVTIADVLSSSEEYRIKQYIRPKKENLKLSDGADITGNGFFQIGLQYHFTMEPQTTVVIPFEEGLHVYSATQWMDHTQAVIAKSLKLRVADVHLEVRRLGGAYGAKITRCNQVACAASLVAYKLNRPTRFVQTIESMMNCNGKRWACSSEYEFHIKTNGKIVGLKNSILEDAGCTTNENPIELLTLKTVVNCYQFTADNLVLSGKAVLTDAPSASWCRAPGSAEGISTMETIIEHMAFEAKLDPADVRLVNIVPGNKLEKLFPNFLETREYRVRRREIDSYNKQNRWVKRGIGLAIMDYPIEYEFSYPATVAIYHSDGTVVISHGGIEMGQGINTKVAQVAAFVLGIPYELVKIEVSNTVTGANAFVTASSFGSECVCFAVRKACNTLNDRLKPIRQALKPDATWQQIVQAAWGKSINLLASEQYKAGDMESYHVYGMSMTEVEVDMLTGKHEIKRVDIVEDAGESLSPNVDIGQIEGSFIMSLGYFLTEDIVYDRQTGQLLTDRTWNYKPPGAKDIPIDFRVEILPNNPHPAGFMRSKATGEPPFCLGVSVLFAIQHALQSARQDAGLAREWVRLGAPTTPETILLASGTDPKLFCLKPKSDLEDDDSSYCVVDATDQINEENKEIYSACRLT